MKELIDEVRAVIKDAVKKLGGYKRRAFQALSTLKYFGGSARKAGRETGWGRESVQKGLKESESGIRCPDNYKGRGRNRTEENFPDIGKDIRSIVEPQSQADPALKSSPVYTRITAKAVRQTLIDVKGYSDEELPTDKTVGSVLNRMGYNLKRVLKAKPLKKIGSAIQVRIH